MLVLQWLPVMQNPEPKFSGRFLSHEPMPFVHRRGLGLRNEIGNMYLIPHHQDVWSFPQALELCILRVFPDSVPIETVLGGNAENTVTGLNRVNHYFPLPFLCLTR